MLEEHRRPDVAAVNLGAHREQGYHRASSHQGSGTLPDPGFPPNPSTATGLTQLKGVLPKGPKSPRQARQDASKRSRGSVNNSTLQKSEFTVPVDVLLPFHCFFFWVILSIKRRCLCTNLILNYSGRWGNTPPTPAGIGTCSAADSRPASVTESVASNKVTFYIQSRPASPLLFTHTDPHWRLGGGG